jgi:diketogulonate reductase-like aldo/keto reductase
MRTVTFPDSTPVPALGQGTWRMGEDQRLRKQETAALRAGIDLGMTLIDTAEMYGDGATETFLGEALAGLRDRIFLVSKVYPQNAGRGRIERACEASLQRLKTDRLDLYLLHWRGSVPLAETIEGMEALVRAGKSRRWGVSNLDHGDMEQLFRAGGDACATDQVLYNVTERGAEFDLLPQLGQRKIPAMAYSPVSQGRLPPSPALAARGQATRGDALPGGSGLGAARSCGHRHSQGQRRGSCHREPPRPGPEVDGAGHGRDRRGLRAADAEDAPGDALTSAVDGVRGVKDANQAA